MAQGARPLLDADGSGKKSSGANEIPVLHSFEDWIPQFRRHLVACSIIDISAGAQPWPEICYTAGIDPDIALNKLPRAYQR